MRTIEELETKMRARGLSMQVFGTADACIVVWLYAADDPELGVFPGEGNTLLEALEEAFASWDQNRKPKD
jgi:hypothetical protein